MAGRSELSAVIAAETVIGTQAQGVISMLKHVSLNGYETKTFWLDAIIEPVAHRESNLLTFQSAIERSQPGSLTGGSNRVNGAYNCGNDALLYSVVKGVFGFKGRVMSDGKAVYDWNYALKGLDQPLHDLLQAGHALLVSYSQVAQADLVGLDHSPLWRPHTGMQARIDCDGDLRGETNALPTADWEQLCQRYPFLFHDAHRLVRTDDRGPGPLGDALGSPKVVEVGVADHDPVGPLDVIRSQAGARSRRDAINIGIQEYHQPSDREPEGGATVPVKPRCHRM